MDKTQLLWYGGKNSKANLQACNAGFKNRKMTLNCITVLLGITLFKLGSWPSKSSGRNLSLWGRGCTENEWDLEMGLRTWEVIREHQETYSPNEFRISLKSILSKKYFLNLEIWSKKLVKTKIVTILPYKRK